MSMYIKALNYLPSFSVIIVTDRQFNSNFTIISIQLQFQLSNCHIV